jgi:hypothetical protein
MASFEKEGISIQWEKKEIDRDNFVLYCGSQVTAGNIVDALEMIVS